MRTLAVSLAFAAASFSAPAAGISSAAEGNQLRPPWVNPWARKTDPAAEKAPFSPSMKMIPLGFNRKTPLVPVIPMAAHAGRGTGCAWLAAGFNWYFANNSRLTK